MAGEVFDPNKVYVRSGTRNILSSTPNLDAFGRLRVSNPTTLLDNTFQYNLSPLTWNQKNSRRCNHCTCSCRKFSPTQHDNRFR